MAYTFTKKELDAARAAGYGSSRMSDHALAKALENMMRSEGGDTSPRRRAKTVRKNPVAATAAQVFEKARQSGYPTEGFTAQQLVDAMWPNGEVRLRGSGAKVVLRGRTSSAMAGRKMVGNPGPHFVVGESVLITEMGVSGKIVKEDAPGWYVVKVTFPKGDGSAMYRVKAEFLMRENPRGGRKAAPKKLKDVQYTAKGQPFVVLANGQHRFISRAAAGVTHEDLVDAGLRRNPGLVWKESSGALVALGKGNKTRYMIDENYGHKDTGYHFVLHVAPTLGGRGTSYAAKTIDHAKEMAEASEDPSLRKNPNLRRNHHLQPGDAFVTPEGWYGWVTGAPKGGRYPVKWQGGSKGTVKDTGSAAVPI